jgi:hypothetical protein
MKKSRRMVLGAGLLFSSALYLAIHWPVTAAQSGSPEATQPEKLTIVWTSGDPEVAHRMVLMYGHAAQRNEWFDEVRLIIWGPSARLTAADKDIQAKLAEMKRSGVALLACVVCADSYGVSDRLRELEIDVRPMGIPLTDTIKDSGTHLVTF